MPPGAPPFLQAQLSILPAARDLKAPVPPPPGRRPNPPPFSPIAAVALLRQYPPQLDQQDRASPEDLRKLEEASGQEANRIVNHLWDAKEEGMLTPAELVWAAALTRVCDGVLD
jgi:hypothetical protein